MRTRGLIFKIILEIVFVTFISIVLIDLSSKKEIQKKEMLAISQDVIVKETINNKNLYLINDNANVNLNNNIISIVNNKNINIKCHLIIIIDKNSTVDINYLRYKINSEVKKFDNLIYEDGSNYYYLIDDISIDANSDIDEEFVMWLSDEYKNLDQNTLSYKIIADEIV